MSDPAKKVATYQDVLDAPTHMVAEVFGGESHLNPRPAKPHAAAASALGEELGPPFKRVVAGPVAGSFSTNPSSTWGRTFWCPVSGDGVSSMAEMVDDEPYFTVAPDWICEVLSARTAKHDRTDKLDIYRREGVRLAWLVDPLQRTLEALRLQEDKWLLLGTWRDDAMVRAEPFDAIELDLSALWYRVVLRER